MTTYIPPIYVYGMIDVPGVVASNNFLSILNPSNSTVFHVPLEIGFTCYTSTTAQTIGSLAVYRITAASGGTAVSATDVNEFRTAQPTQQAQLRIANPTVTRLNNTPILFKAPVISTGGGNSGTVTIQNPSTATFVLAPGEGLVFNTAQGNTGQSWCIAYSWMEKTIK